MTKSAKSSAVSDIGALPGVSTYTWASVSDCAVLSPAAQDLLGVAGPISTDDFFAHVHPDDRVRFEAETVSHLETGGEITREFRFVRDDGTLRHVIAHASIERCETTGQDRISGIFIDVTAARATPGTVDPPGGGRFGFYDFDVATATSTWSPALRRMFMAPSSMPVSSDMIYDSIHPDDRERTRALMLEAMATAGPFEMTFRSILPDGRTIHVRDRGEAHGPVDPVTGKVARVTGTLTDITGTARIPEAAMDGDAVTRKLASDTFWRLIDAAPVGAYAVDADLKMVRVSRNGRAAFAEIDDLLGRDLDEILHIVWPEPFAAEAVARFRHTLLTGEAHHADPVIDTRADRNILEAYDWSVERIVLEDGRHGVLCYFYDLSERVRHEQMVEEQRRRLALAYDAARMGAWEVDLVSGETKGTPQLSALLGAPGYAGDVTALWESAIHDDDLASVDTAFRAAMTGGAPFDVDFRIVTETGEVRHMAARGDLVRDAAGRPVRMIGVDQDITPRKTSELALRLSEERMRMVLDHTLAFVGVLDLDGTLQEVNDFALDFAGATRADVIGKPFWETIWWAHDMDIADLCRQAVADGQAGRSRRFDVVLRGAQDRLITIDFMLAPVFGDAGELRMLVVSGMDISGREEARARERALMGEINHRTKNVLTLVQVLARQTARGGAVDFVARFEARVSALGKAQDLLFQSIADSVDLRSLAESQLGHFRDMMDSRIHLSGPDVELAADAAQAIGMALHELATNAGKYGALSTDEGYIDVTWTVDAPVGAFTIHWAERGGPVVVPPQKQGFGSTVIDQMARSVLDAEVLLDYAPDGVEWRLTCALEALAGSRLGQLS